MFFQDCTLLSDGQCAAVRRETFREWTDSQGAHGVREGSTTYDAAGRVVTSTSFSNPALDADGETTTTHYDALGRVDWTKDDFGGYTINTYDLRGNLIRTLYPDHTETRTVYDDMGRAVYSMERFASSTSPLDRDIAISRVQLHREAPSPTLLGRDDRRAAAEERVIHVVALAAVVADRPRHALHGLLGVMNGLTGIIALRRLRASKSTRSPPNDGVRSYP